MLTLTQLSSNAARVWLNRRDLRWSFIGWFALGAVPSAVGGGLLAATGVATVVATAAMTVLLTTPIALAASVGRGYLPGVGVMMAAIFFAQVIAALGYGRYFPWLVPALFSGLAGPDSDPPGPLGVVLVLLVGVVGVTATALWWRNADQDR